MNQTRLQNVLTTSIKRTASGLLLLLALCSASTAAASYAIYVGRDLTTDGSVFLGGSGDEVSSHWLEVVPARSHPKDATITVGVDETAFLPGELMQIPQAPETLRYLTMNYSEYEGFPPPLTNGGLNERGVAARDVWMDSRPELVAMTPNPQRGPNYSDLSRIAMERAHSAEHAVELLGALIDEYGYSSYGGNSHLFADAKEGWVFLDFAGGEGLWVARRLGPDEVVMLFPGYLGELPGDVFNHPDFRASENFIDFAVEQGWYDPEAGIPFNVTGVYGTPYIRYPRQEVERELANDAPIDLRRMMAAVRDRRYAKDTTGYGQVAQLNDTTPDMLRTLWVAPTGSVTAPFLPWRIGVQRIPPEYGKHRYLTKGESRRFLTEDWQIQEATEFAGRLFKRLMYFTCESPARYLPEVNEALTAFEDGLIEDQVWLEASAFTLMDAGRDDLAGELLTRYLEARAQDAMDLGRALLASIEARTRLTTGIRTPQGDEVSRLDYQMITCRDDELQDLP